MRACTAPVKPSLRPITCEKPKELVPWVSTPSITNSSRFITPFPLQGYNSAKDGLSQEHHGKVITGLSCWRSLPAGFPGADGPPTRQMLIDGTARFWDGWGSSCSSVAQLHADRASRKDGQQRRGAALVAYTQLPRRLYSHGCSTGTCPTRQRGPSWSSARCSPERTICYVRLDRGEGE